METAPLGAALPLSLSQAHRMQVSVTSSDSVSPQDRMLPGILAKSFGFLL